MHKIHNTLQTRYIITKKKRDICSDICTYEKFDESEHKVFCNCVYDGEKRIRTDIELEIIKIFENFQKNYIFFCNECIVNHFRNSFFCDLYNFAKRNF